MSAETGMRDGATSVVARYAIREGTSKGSLRFHPGWTAFCEFSLLESF